MSQTMSDQDKATIMAFAAGDHSLRDAAIEAHRRNIDIVGARGNLHQKFMAEIDTSSPDVAMRASLRRDLVQSAPSSEASCVPKP
ncbi:hypothetical protein [Bosea sp. RAC05]|uniref:hypothetical protein n=1 Tax=Bosea sp. RAC05 TaxID=1842539 RepID=UPI00083CAD3A|nr:hypothetical protein [Bosea sp. RAC05]AOG03308.1 hypothetical protein BSY19_5176 [Bosea sp. RAC05]